MSPPPFFLRKEEKNNYQKPVLSIHIDIYVASIFVLYRNIRHSIDDPSIILIIIHLHLKYYHSISLFFNYIEGEIYATCFHNMLPQLSNTIQYGREPL